MKTSPTGKFLMRFDRAFCVLLPMLQRFSSVAETHQTPAPLGTVTIGGGGNKLKDGGYLNFLFAGSGITYRHPKQAQN